MSNVIAATAPSPIKPPDRGLIWGVLVSLLLHALLLSLQFGIPGFRPGPGGRLTVRLVPLPAHPAPRPEPAPVPPVPLAASPVIDVPAPMPATPAPLAPPPAQAQPVQHAQPGFTLIDPPRPQPAPPPPAVRPPRAPRRRLRPRARVRHDGLHTKVIAQDAHKDDGFAVPPAASVPAPDADPNAEAEASAKVADTLPVPPTPAPEPEPAAVTAPAPQPEVAQAPQPDTPPAEPSEAERQAERDRLAEQLEQERAARRDADERALQAAADADARRAADQQARLMAQQGARYEDELAARQREAEEEAQRQAAARAQAAQAARELAEQQRIQAEQAAAQQLAEAQRIQAEQARAQQLAEQQRIQAEQARAQQLAEQQRIQAEQVKAQQLAEQARAQRQAEQLAREKAAQAAQAAQTEQAERLARQEPARHQPDSGLDTWAPARSAAPGNSGLDGPGRGAGALPRSALDSPFASRARELLRGIDIDKPVPQAMRPAEDARRNLRRALAEAAQHDVPLRLYVDSIRQKIERNAIVSPSQLAADAVRIFPIVSIAVRSDGSIEDVTIVRSSGRADVDEVVRRIVRLNARYAAFPPNVAANYDVVELRRIWSFAGALRLLEEMR